MLRVTFLGTAAARPTVHRGTSSIAVQRESDLFLFDCGEGTQRQMMRFGSGFSLSAIFITHTHADHYVGIIGLVRTLGLQGREEPLTIYGPPGSSALLRTAVDLGGDRLTFPVHVEERAGGESVSHADYRIEAVSGKHGITSVGWALREEPRLGRFNPERARELGVPSGPLFGRLHRGETIEVEGRTVHPDEVTGPPRPGRLFLYSGDTRPTSTIEEAARGADLLVHEATFTQESARRARETHHSTAAEAARLARRAGVRQLILTHISARHADNPKPLEKEARKVFPHTRIAYDGMVVEIPFPDEGDASGGDPGEVRS